MQSSLGEKEGNINNLNEEEGSSVKDRVERQTGLLTAEEKSIKR